VSEYWVFAVLGLGGGAVFAMLAAGIVLEYRSAGVINFAHGALAMFVAYVFVELKVAGDLVFPVVGIPDRINLSDDGLTLWPALLTSLMYAAVLGVLVYALIFRSLRQSNPFTRIVASVGLMITLQALAVLKFGTQARAIAPILPSEPVTLFGATVPKDRLYLAGIAVFASLVLAVVYRCTPFGLKTRAAAENEKGAVLVGVSPERLAVLNWVLATVLAGLAGILILPITALNPVIYTLFIVPALGAALVGRFTSFTIASLAALLIGIAISEISKLQLDFSWLPDTGLKEAVPFLVILGAVTLLGRRIPSRGTIEDVGLPKAGRPQHPLRAATVLMLVVVPALYLLQGGYRLGLIQSIVTATVCLSLVVLAGYGGQISLAQVALAGASGFVLSKVSLDLGVPFPLAMFLAAFAVVPLGLLIGLPALRVRGVSLAVVTLGAAVAIDSLVIRNTSFSGGDAGSVVPPADLFGISFDIRGNSPGEFPRPIFGVMAVVVLASTALLVANLRRSPTGRRLLAVRSNERAATASGINVANAKLFAFGFSAFIAGLGGALIGYQNEKITPDSYTVFASITILAIAYIGGIGYITGSLVAGLFLAVGGLGPVFLDRTINYEPYELLVAGIGLLIGAITNPAGIANAMFTAWEHVTAYLRRVARRIHRRESRSVSAGTSEATRPYPQEGSQRRHAPANRIAACGAVSSSQGQATALSVDGLSVAFGGVHALNDVTLRVASGSITGLIGPNGAGKTTFIDAVTGYVEHQAGAVSFHGDRIDGLRPHARALHGLARTFQTVELFDDLTVRENVLVAVERQRWWSSMSDLVVPRRPLEADVDWALECVGLNAHRGVLPAELPHGQRKLAGVARAIAARPSVLLLDEPAAGLDTEESRHFGERLRDISRTGITILLIDHDMNLVLDLCDQVWVLDFGKVIASGAPSEIRVMDEVVTAYLGTSMNGTGQHDREPEPA